MATDDSCARPGLMSVAEARARLLQAAVPLRDVEEIPLVQLRGRVLARDGVSGIDVPPADNSAMDGYALRFADLQADVPLPVTQRIPAGAVPRPLGAGTAARIFTGATIPDGADTVVMQEDVIAGDGTLQVRGDVLAGLRCGDNIRPRGQDIAAGSVVLSAGTVLGPAQIGVLAATGLAVVPVVRRLRVTFFSTGDELLEPGCAPAAGRIFNSNRYALRAWLENAGCEAIDGGVIADRRADTEAALRAAAACSDLVVTTGGASVGEEDHLRAALAAAGDVGLWKVAIKPGKPLLFGHVDGAHRVPVLGLPGNPVSVAVTFLVLALPFLRAMQGATVTETPALRVPAGFAVRKAGKRTEYLRVRLATGPSGTRLERFGNQSSGVLTSMAWADGFAVIPAGVTVAEGELVEYRPLLSGLCC